MIHYNEIVKCIECGWKCKTRKYDKMEEKLKIINPYNNKNNYETRVYLYNNRSTCFCAKCGNYLLICPLCKQRPVGRCIVCDHEQSWSKYGMECSCDSYDCA